MTHLLIEQNGIERVSPSIISTLDNLTKTGQTDATSNLKGTLTTSTAYQNPVTRLTNRFSELTIVPDTYLAYFVDEYEQSAVAEIVGDLNGHVTVQEADMINTEDQSGSHYQYSVRNPNDGRFIKRVFENNNIRTLDLTPFKYVRGIVSWSGWLKMPSLVVFNGGHLKFTSWWHADGLGGNDRAIANPQYCTSLRYFTFPNADIVGSHCFYENSRLEYALFAKASYILGYHLRGSDRLKIIYFGQNIKYVDSRLPDWNSDPSNTIKLVFNKTVTDVNECPKAFSSCTVPAADVYYASGGGLSYFESNSTFTEISTLDTGNRKWGKIDVYVPDECVSIYQQSVWNQVGVYGISTLSTDEKNAIRDYAHENDPVFV